MWDEVILPEETRDRLLSSFSFLRDKNRCGFGVAASGIPGYRHGNIPL